MLSGSCAHASPDFPGQSERAPRASAYPQREVPPDQINRHRDQPHYSLQGSFGERYLSLSVSNADDDSDSWSPLRALPCQSPVSGHGTPTGSSKGHVLGGLSQSRNGATSIQYAGPFMPSRECQWGLVDVARRVAANEMPLDHDYEIPASQRTL